MLDTAAEIAKTQAGTSAEAAVHAAVVEGVPSLSDVYTTTPIHTLHRYRAEIAERTAGIIIRGADVDPVANIETNASFLGVETSNTSQVTRTMGEQVTKNVLDTKARLQSFGINSAEASVLAAHNTYTGSGNTTSAQTVNPEQPLDAVQSEGQETGNATAQDQAEAIEIETGLANVNELDENAWQVTIGDLAAQVDQDHKLQVAVAVSTDVEVRAEISDPLENSPWMTLVDADQTIEHAGLQQPLTVSNDSNNRLDLGFSDPVAMSTTANTAPLSRFDYQPGVDQNTQPEEQTAVALSTEVTTVTNGPFKLALRSELPTNQINREGNRRVLVLGQAALAQAA